MRAAQTLLRIVYPGFNAYATGGARRRKQGERTQNASPHSAHVRKPEAAFPHGSERAPLENADACQVLDDASDNAPAAERRDMTPCEPQERRLAPV